MSNSTQNDWEKKLSSLIDDTIENRHDYEGPLVEEDDILFERLNENLKPFVTTLLADARREVITTKIDRLKLYEVIENIYLSGLYSHDKGVLHQYMSDIINVLATLKEEQI